MKLYHAQSNIVDPSDEAAGMPEEWFSSLEQAKAWARNLLSGGDDEDCDGDAVEIESVEIFKMPLRQLVIACLNRSQYVRAGSRVKIATVIRKGGKLVWS